MFLSSHHFLRLCFLLLQLTLFIFKMFKNHSAFVLTEEVAVAEEEDGELCKTGISFTGMIGKLPVSGQQWKYCYT